MPGATPIYGLPYALIGDQPHGPNQEEALAVATEATFVLFDARIDALEGKSQKLIGRARRTTPSDPSTGAKVGVLRLNVPCTSAKLYVVEGFCHPTSSVTSDNIEAGFTFDTSGNADASDPILPGSRTFGLFGQVRTIKTVWVASTTGTLSVAMYVKRDTGSGNNTMFADTTERFTEIFIYEVDTDPGNTGVNLP